MKGLRTVFKIVSLILVLGTLLTLLLTLLTGASEKSILKKFYWLETDCSDYPGAPVSTQCRWTYYNLCGVADGNNVDCTKSKPAYAFSPKRNFESDENLPRKFIDNSNYYYYMSRIGWAFTLVGTAFAAFALVPFIVIFFTSKNIPAVRPLLWIFWILAVVFAIVGIALSTAAFAKGKTVFHDDGRAAKLGTKTMAVAWTSVFLLLFDIPFLAMASKGSSGPTQQYYDDHEFNDSEKYTNNTTASSNGGWYKRKDIPKSDQIVPGEAAIAVNDTSTSANYLNFTPVKDTHPAVNGVTAKAVAVSETPADNALFP